MVYQVFDWWLYCYDWRGRCFYVVRVCDYWFYKGACELMDDELLLDDVVVTDDTEEPKTASTEIVSQETAPVSYQDYTESLSTISNYLSVVVIVLLVWFASWLLRSWRTWIVKVR
jgi:hypothetical protein